MYEGVLGMEVTGQYHMESEEKIRGVRYRLGDVVLELMEGTAPDSEVAKFVEKKGEGIFVVSYLVEDVEKALSDLKDEGFTLIDEKPREYKGARYAFTLHPKELCGVLTELVDEPSRDF
jgi:methylmalonyl-CoA/ethylmalonyl-CoA epimerase